MMGIRTKRWINNVMVSLLLASCLTLYSSSPPKAAASQTATITVDASDLEGTGSYTRLEHYNNLAGLDRPGGGELEPGDIELLQDLGHQLLRTWLGVTSYYDPATNTYDYSVNYVYFDKAASMTERIMISLGGSDKDVTNGNMTMQQFGTALEAGLKHYKERYPKIEYIECLNEASARMNDDDYYTFYKKCYEAVNHVNQTLNPIVPLKIGGPITGGLYLNVINDFLVNFKQDTASGKRIDFISWHEYRVPGEVAKAQDDEQQVRDLLAANSLNTEIPLFVTEYGVFGDSGPSLAQDILTQAAGMASMGYYYMGQDIIPMHWVSEHKNNERKNQLVKDKDGVPTPYYNMMKMQSMLKSSRVAAHSSALDADGIGVYGLATKDSSGLAVMAWNYQYTRTASSNPAAEEYSVTLDINNLPTELANRSVRMQRYLIDSTHSNYLYNIGNAGLEKVEDVVVSASSSLSRTFFLEKNAVSLLVLTPEDGSPPPSENVLTDSFDDGNDNGWTRVRGTWSVTNGEYAATQQGSISVSGQSTWRDYTMQAKVKKSSRIPAVLARYQDSQNFYNLEITNSALDLWKNVNGSWAKIGSYAVTLNDNTWYTIKLELNGSSIKGYLNGTERISVTDNAHSQGQIGLRGSVGSGTAYFDDVEARY